MAPAPATANANSRSELMYMPFNSMMGRRTPIWRKSVPYRSVAKLGIEIINEIHAAHDEIGIGDPHHIDPAENQIKSERKQREHAAEQDAVDDRLEKINVHRLCSLLLLSAFYRPM